MADAGFGQDDDQLLAEFQAAADHLAAAVSSDSKAYNDAAKLTFYGLYKQATVGACTGSRPSFWNPASQAKWDAWNKLGQTPKDAAMQQYVEELTRLTPGWNAAAQGTAGKRRAGGGIGGPVFSSLAGNDPAPASGDAGAAEARAPLTLHELAGQGDLAAVTAALSGSTAGGTATLVDGRDESGCTALHFAADRGVADEVIRALVAAGADVDARDEDGQTPLHYAAVCGHERACKLLLELGADACAEDSEGQPPQAVAPPEWTFWAPPSTSS